MEEKRTISLRSRPNSCARVAFLDRTMDPRHPAVSSPSCTCIILQLIDVQQCVRKSTQQIGVGHTYITR